MTGLIVRMYCDACGALFRPAQVERCFDCDQDFCAACAPKTGHRTVHEGPAAYEAEERPQGWSYLRCADTPFSIHDGV